MPSKIEIVKDIPQYEGDPETFEEYQERAWDLYFGRAGRPEQLG